MSLGHGLFNCFGSDSLQVAEEAYLTLIEINRVALQAAQLIAETDLVKFQLIMFKLRESSESLKALVNGGLSINDDRKLVSAAKDTCAKMKAEIEATKKKSLEPYIGNLWQITPEQFKKLPDGTKLTAINGKQYIKGQHQFSTDIHFGYLSFGFRKGDKVPVGIGLTEQPTWPIKKKDLKAFE